MLKAFTDLIYNVLGNWWAFSALLVLSGVLFGYVVPRAQRPIFAHAPPDLPRKVLDVHMMTWTPAQARRLLEEIGPEGRRAYQAFYLQVDFWFPTLVTSLLYCSLLALAFPQGSRFAWLAPWGMLGWVFDEAENITHFRMVRSYPKLSGLSLRWGPVFTYCKWLLAIVTPVIGVVGFVGRLL